MSRGTGRGGPEPVTRALNAGLPRGDYDALMEVIVNRRSVRELDYVDIPEADLRKILDAGRWAPSGANTQPWSFVVIRDRQKIERLAETYVTERRQMIADHLDKSPQYFSRTELYTLQVEALPKEVGCVVVVLGDARIVKYYPFMKLVEASPSLRERLRAVREVADPNDLFYSRPLIPRGGLEIWLASLAAAIQNMQLATWSLGYGTIWGTVYPMLETALRDLCRLPEHQEPAAVLPIGKPRDTFKEPRYRRRLDRMIHWDEFDPAKEVSDDDLDEWIVAVRRRRYRLDARVPDLPDDKL